MSSTYPDHFAPGPAQQRGSASREVESLLWLAAGAAWAVVALKAFSEARRLETRKRVFSISERMLHEVFPNGIRP